MPKAVSSILTQIRVEKIGLAGNLFTIKRAEEPACECNNILKWQPSHLHLCTRLIIE